MIKHILVSSNAFTAPCLVRARHTCICMKSCGSRGTQQGEIGRTKPITPARGPMYQHVVVLIVVVRAGQGAHINTCTIRCRYRPVRVGGGKTGMKRVQKTAKAGLDTPRLMLHYRPTRTVRLACNTLRGRGPASSRSRASRQVLASVLRFVSLQVSQW